MWTIQPILEDELVKLRPLKADDFEDLFTVASDPLIWEQHPVKTRSTGEGFKRFFNESLDSEGAMLIIDKKTGTCIGSSRFKIIDTTSKVIEIGWTFLSRKYWGGTYNKAIKKLMINHALMGFKLVVLYVGRDNIRSQRAVRKIGGKAVSSPTFPWMADKSSGNITFAISHPII